MLIDHRDRLEQHCHPSFRCERGSGSGQLTEQFGDGDGASPAHKDFLESVGWFTQQDGVVLLSRKRVVFMLSRHCSLP